MQIASQYSQQPTFGPDQWKFAGAIYDRSLEILSYPRVQGSMQAFGGFVEAGAGAYATLGSGGLAASIGWPVLVHGLDQLITGMSTVFSGKYRDTLTSQLLQTTGMSPQTAGMIDNGISVVGSMGAVTVVRAHQLAKFPLCDLPSQRVANISKEFQETRNVIKLWPSASKESQVVNGLEYIPHALERMSPRGLIQQGTEIVSRGIPPSVVENAIKFGTKIPGNTSNEIVHIFENVRVVTNPEGTRVITVITTGR